MAMLTIRQNDMFNFRTQAFLSALLMKMVNSFRFRSIDQMWAKIEMLNMDWVEIEVIRLALEVMGWRLGWR